MNQPRLTDAERQRAVELIRSIYRRPDGGAGCCLHCLLDDGNFDDQFLVGCEETANDDLGCLVPRLKPCRRQGQRRARWGDKAYCVRGETALPTSTVMR